jgi:hypothetical protein
MLSISSLRNVARILAFHLFLTVACTACFYKQIEYDIPGIDDEIAIPISLPSSTYQYIADFDYQADDYSNWSEGEFREYLRERYSSWHDVDMSVSRIVFSGDNEDEGVSLRISNSQASPSDLLSADELARFAFSVLRDACSYYNHPDHCKAAIYRSNFCEGGTWAPSYDTSLRVPCEKGFTWIVNYVTAVNYKGEETAFTITGEDLFKIDN